MGLRRRSLLPALLLSLVVAVVMGQEPSLEEVVPTAEVEQRIAELIQQLGAPQFRMRERAEKELRSMGLVAIESLREMEDFEDIEVRLRARQLVAELRERFIQDGVPPELQPLLEGYDRLSYNDRQQRLFELAPLAQQTGMGVLARLARFEESELLAKKAALYLLGMDLAADDQLAQRKKLLLASIGFSRRVAVEWIRSYLQSFEDPDAALSQFETWLKNEQTLLDSGIGKTDQNIVNQLSRVRIDMLLHAGRRDAAMQGMQQLAADVELSPTGALLFLEWLMDRSAWEVIEEMFAKHKERFDRNALLLYRLAEAYRMNERDEAAQEAAQRAFAAAGVGVDAYAELYAGVLGLSLTNRLRQHQTDDSARRYALALMLDDDRGQLDWAEREYREVIQATQNEADEYRLRAQITLAEMLHDQLRDEAAAELLREIVDSMQKSPEMLRVVQHRLDREPHKIKSRMHYFQACHAAQQPDHRQQREQLEAGIAADPTDADVLIAMYRLPAAPPDWQERTRRLIGQAATGFLQEIRQLRQDAQRSNSEVERELYEFQVAFQENQFAWLVGNTEGDIEEAIRSSQHSLKVFPGNAGYLDTLARCYFRHGDLKKAVECQRQAVQRSPHERQIRRQLELFETKLQELEGVGAP